MMAELRPVLMLLKADFEAASKIHIPNWKGGPNAGILAELVRMGWRKSEANMFEHRPMERDETPSARAATDETVLRLAAPDAEVNGLKDRRSEVKANPTRACLQLRENGLESDAERFVFRMRGGFPNQQMSDS